MSVARSLHVGLDRVSGFRYGRRLPPLRSSPIDAIELARAAAARGFSAVTLADERATVAAVREELSAAARELRRGDTFALTYSGHGLAGTTPAGFQQSWCLFDETLVRFGDDGLDALLAAFRSGVRLLVVANCCYAASRGVRTPPTPRPRAHLVRITASTGRDVTFDRPDGKGPSPFVSAFLDALASHDDGGFAGFYERLSGRRSAMTSPQMEIERPHCSEFLRLGPFRLRDRALTNA